MSDIQGCTDPRANNYNATATSDNGSCTYVLRHNNACYGFAALPPPEDRSFTLSYSVLGNCWVFYHDYIPDLYFHTRDALYSVKDNAVRKHHEGAPGMFDGNTPKSFFIDIVFHTDSDFMTETVSWTTEVLNALTEVPFETFTHISLWNSYQHSGRIALSQLWQDLEYSNVRRTKGEWSFNDFLNILKEDPGEYLSSIFQNFTLQPGSIDTGAAWYERGPLDDRWVCLRLEHDNSTGNTLLLDEAQITILKSDR